MDNLTGSRWFAAAALCFVVSCGNADVAPEPSQEGLEGNLQVYIVNYDDGTTEVGYALETEDGSVYDLEFVAEPPEQLATGDRVRVVALDITDARIVVDSIALIGDEEGLDSIEQELTGNAVRTNSRLAALLVNWSAPDSTTVEDMRSRLFTGTTSTQAFYTENSYALLSMQGDVFGWFTVPAMTNCGYQTMATNARTAARNAGVPIDSYNQVLYYFPRTSQCGWSGLAFLGRPTSPAQYSWYNGSKGCVVLAQEILHNFGARHSRSYNCSSGGQRVPIAPAAQCSFSEYGDPYDPMGGGCYHVNTYQKSAQGWLGGCNAVTVTSNGEFDIVPTELPSNGIQTVRVRMSTALCPSDMTSCYYYLEYRQPIGIFDSRDPGAPANSSVLVHVGPGVDFTGGSSPRNPYILDMTPSTSGYRDGGLVQGATFADPAGTAITVVSLSSGNARVRVSFAGGGSGAPLCIDGSSPGGTPPPPPPPPPPTGNCGTGESAFEGACYALTGSAATYAQAETTCMAKGTGWGLAEVSSSGENSFISSLIGTTESWLGATDITTEGSWFWESGTQFWSGGATGASVGGRYTNFVSGEPNDLNNSDCLRMISGGGWRDGPCGSSFRAVCEKRPTCAAGETAFEAHCYAVTASASTYDVASTACQSRGTGWRLATVSSGSENNFVSSLIGATEHWIGATDRAAEGTFVWESNGVTFWSGGATGAVVGGNFTSFASGEPNDGNASSDCLRITAGGLWRDIQCTSNFRGVCESGN